jgi:hypothetical protein
MPTYSAKPPRAFVSETHTPEQRPTVTVHEDEREPVDTGLVNAEGWPLYRQPERWPLGFVAGKK